MTRHAALLPVAAAVSVAAAPPPDAPTGTNIRGGQTSTPVQQIGNVAPDWHEGPLVAVAKTRRVVRKFAQCVVARHPEQSATVILNDLSNERIIRDYSVLRDVTCALNAEKTYDGIKLSFPGDTFRYVVAEALVNAEVPQALSDVAAIAPLPKRRHDPASFAPREKRPNAKMLQAAQQASLLDEAQIFALQLGECVVRKDPYTSYKLLQTEPATPEEDAAIAALAPRLGGCAPAGQRLAMDIVMVRGAVAVSYYRLAKASRPSVQAAH